ncbi:MAG TPA: hypothetical protein VF910_07220 [Candidatus Bathyarchaeia archaeon]
MNFQIINLSKYPYQPITDFATARNYFIDKLERDQWILFVDDDEEPSQMLLNHIRELKPTMPYYAIRIIGLEEGRYMPDWNPNFSPRLVSTKVCYTGKIHETIRPRKPYGIIDFPIIHNHTGPKKYPKLLRHSIPIVSRAWWITKKLVEVARGR